MAKIKKQEGSLGEPVGKFGMLKNKLKSSRNDYLFVEEAHKNPVVPSGKWGWDYVTGIGGAPIGRSIELNGKEGSGKTTLALAIAANAQKLGMHVLFLDYEHAIDTVYAQAQGLSFDPELLTIEQPSCIEEGEEIFNSFMELGEPIVVIQDSLPAMIPKVFIVDPESRRKQPGLQSRMQSMFFNSAIRKLVKTKSLLISLNQMRANFQMTGPVNAFTPKDKASGGYANKHFQSQIFNLSIMGKEKEDVTDSFEGKSVKQEKYLKIKVVNKKNKVGRPYLGALMYLEIGGGFDNIRNLIDAAEQKKIIVKKGSWYTSEFFNGEQFQGTSKLTNYLRANKDIIQSILLELGWIKSDGSWDLSSSYSVYDASPDDTEDEEDEDFDEDSSED